MTLFFRTIALAALAWSVLPAAARADNIDAIYAFGDSLSDVGNIYTVTSGTPLAQPLPPYYMGEFSNGPIWLQDMAGGLGLAPLTPSVLGGTDYAYGGGETAPETYNVGENAGNYPFIDILGPTGQLAQYENFLTTNSATADPNALYTIWIGSNDLFDIAANDPANATADLATVLANTVQTITTLESLGATNFLVATVPDLGTVPESLAGGPLVSAGLTALSGGFDSGYLDPALASLAATPGVNLQVLNTYLILDSMVNDPATYGFTNVTDPCLVGTTPCANPDQYLFWDGMHPTAAADSFLASDAVGLVTPEPVTFLLSGLGLLGVALLRRQVPGGRKVVILSADGVDHS